VQHRIYWMLILASVGFGQNWEMKSIIPEIGTAFNADIAADSLCLPHVAFERYSLGLAYASWTGDSWSFEYPDVGVLSSLDFCLDLNDNPHIGYTMGDRPFGVRYACRDADTWHIDTVAPRGGGVSLAVARDGTPHMVFVDSLVKYAYKAADTWNVLAVPAYQADTLRRLLGASLALDTSDRPGIAVNWTKPVGHRDSLWFSFFEYDGENWHRSDVDSLEPTPFGFPVPRVRSDPATDLFHVVYTAWSYATGKGGNWQVEDAPVPDGACDLALYRGLPYIVGGGGMPVQYTWRTTAGWETEIVGPGSTLGRASIAVDRTGRPHLTFVSADDGSLYYAYRLFDGTEEPAPPAVQPKLQLQVRPNPAPHAFTLEFSVRSPATAAIRLCDALGRNVWSQSERVYPGQYRRRVCLSASISPGVYFLQVESESQRSIEKVVLQ